MSKVTLLLVCIIGAPHILRCSWFECLLINRPGSNW